MKTPYSIQFLHPMHPHFSTVLSLLINMRPSIGLGKLNIPALFLRFVKGLIIKIDITELDRPIFTFLNKVL